MRLPQGVALRFPKTVYTERFQTLPDTPPEALDFGWAVGVFPFSSGPC